MERHRDMFTFFGYYFVSFFYSSGCSLGGYLLSSFISILLADVGIFLDWQLPSPLKAKHEPMNL